MRVANCDCRIFFARFAQSDSELAGDRADFRNIIEEWNVAISGGDAGVARGVEGYGYGRRAAVDVEEFVFAQDGHQFVHQGGVGR